MEVSQNKSANDDISSLANLKEQARAHMTSTNSTFRMIGLCVFPFAANYLVNISVISYWAIGAKLNDQPYIWTLGLLIAMFELPVFFMKPICLKVL